MGFNHISSSPYHSQSNGKSESAIKIAKSILKKVTQERMDTKLAILSQLNASTEGGEYSLVQKLHSTHTTAHLKQILKPKAASGVVDEITLQKQQRIKQQYDRTAKELPALADE